MSKAMKYYKIIGYNAFGELRYSPGLVEDPTPYRQVWNPYNGGIYFCKESILCFLGFGDFVSEVRIPDNTPIVPWWFGDVCWRSPRVELVGPFKRITPAVVRELIADGADPRFNGDKPIYQAISTGDVGLVEVLLEQGVPITVLNPFPLTHEAITYGKIEMLTYLLSKGAEMTYTPLCEAMGNGHTDMAVYLLENGFGIDSEYNYAIGRAVEHDGIQVIRMLLEKAPWPGMSLGNSLVDAADRGNAEAVRILLPYVQDKMTLDIVLFNAAQEGFVEILDMAIEHGADPSWYGNTPIYLAAMHGHSDVVKRLLECKVDAAANENIAIKIAQRNGHQDIVAMLEEYGCKA